MARTRRVAVAWPTILRELRVEQIVDVSATTRRLGLGGPQLGEFEVAGGVAPAFRSDGFDDHVKLLVPLEGTTRPPLPVQGRDRLEWGGAGGRPVAKDYTPRRAVDAGSDGTPRPDGRLEIDVVLHDGGFAAGWARRVAVGDPAWIVGPSRSLLAPTGIDHLVVAGDETALPAIARLLEEQWPEGVGGSVVIDVPGPESRQNLPLPPGVDLTWVHGSGEWLEAVHRLPELPQATFCWLAGESGAVRDARRHLAAELNIPRDCLDATGYWRR